VTLRSRKDCPKACNHSEKSNAYSWFGGRYCGRGGRLRRASAATGRGRASSGPIFGLHGHHGRDRSQQSESEGSGFPSRASKSARMLPRAWPAWWSGPSCLRWIFRIRPARKRRRCRVVSNTSRPWRSKDALPPRPRKLLRFASAERQLGQIPFGNRGRCLAQDACAKYSHRSRPCAKDAPAQAPRAYGPRMGGLVSRPVSRATHRLESCRSGAAFHQTKRIRRPLFRRRSCPQRSPSSEDSPTSAGPYPRS
jgi:hypothetical protein